ncbi:MAG: peptidase MA family metallohydrolase [Elusimicrobiales bacterium]|nr:peptidase MA family metallohydrolase [Elusimicrobiales bacterium]
MRSPSKPIFSVAAALLLAAAPLCALEQNKVLIRDFKWQVRATEHFDIHYYDKSEPWVDYASGVLEAAYKREAADLNPSMSKRVPFFLYASINDMQQTNVADVSDGIGGLTEPFKDRFMVWSDGSKGWLKDVLEHEFAHEVQFSVLIDGFWKSARILKTFIYPLWMMEGIAEYETGLADYALEKMYVRDAALSGSLIPLSRLNQFGHLKPHQTTLAYKTGGQAIRFLAEQYGSDKPRRMLELFRNRYEAGSVLLPLIGTDLAGFERKFSEYTELKYLAEARQSRLQEPETYGPALTAGSDNIPEFNMSPALSPAGDRLAFLSTRHGHPPQVRVKDLATGREKKLTALAAGAENIPYGRFTKPLRSLSWSPDGRWLAFSGQKNHREYLYLYSPDSGKVVRAAVEGLEELRQPVFSPDGKKLAFVGMSGAFNDIYEAPVERLALGGTLPAADLLRLTSGPQDESSPAYSPDGATLAYSCEQESSSGPVRALCLLPRGGAPYAAADAGGSVYDPVFSEDGRLVYFISDAGYDFDLYAYDPAARTASRLTRGMGGVFTPAAGAGKVYFSAFRRGNMQVHAARPENFLYEPVQARAPEAGEAFEVEPATGPVRPYKFKASTDLFFPAFMFSSPGGLFWMNYWQMSDMLGNHNLSMFLNYNSGAEFLSLQANYSYARWRMPLFLQTTALTYGGILNSERLEYDKRYSRHAVGTAWPFDRYNRVQAFAISKNETDEYQDIDFTERLRTRAVQTSYVRDTVDGLYLTAVRGSRTELSWTKAAEVSGGNLKYDAYVLQYLKYFPLSKRAAFVNNFTAGRSTGRDRRLYGYGGLGGVRGFAGSSARTEKPGFFLNNAELRVPLFKDLNYYMWYMFPDFYFKGVYGKLFVDSAYGWERGGDFNSFGSASVDSSVGAGINVHTFILQTFQLVLSFDYAVRTSDGGKIFYFYLGPLF